MEGITAYPGPIVLFGSGETSTSGQKVFDAVFQRLPTTPHAALLETPSGFELNSGEVVKRIAAFLNHSLQNYKPFTEVIPARAKGTVLSPDDPDIVSPLLSADLIFMGPGSPTYAVRHLNNSLAWHYLQARHRLGAALVLASAAVVASSAWALPVYEIYKAGEELHWKPGLDFFGSFGLSLVFIPHWNNTDGGIELDTSRCFMGQSRFARLVELLPADLTLIGIDEKTAVLFDLQAGLCQVMGQGGATLLHKGFSHMGAVLPFELQGSGLEELAKQQSSHVHRYQSGESFPLKNLGKLHVPNIEDGLPVSVWQKALAVENEIHRQSSVPPAVSVLVAEREQARKKKDWASSDRLRDEIQDYGWQVVDTPDGPQLKLSK